MTSTHIGIFGAGQLGAYLCRAARQLGFQTTIVAPDAASPAVKHADEVIVAPLDDIGAARTLVAHSDVITFEREDIAPAVLSELARATKAGFTRVAPSSAHLNLLQDKATQKTWLVQRRFPTAAFVDCPQDATVADLARQVGLPFVQKTHRGGYDGRGVQVIGNLGDDDRLWRARSLVEHYVADKRELSVLVARSELGEVAVYPVVEMQFDAAGNILRHVVSPARIDASVANKAQAIARDVVVALEGVGLFAVEMFLTESEGLLVNEIAPRVHNTGHLTVEAHETSQYEQHLRAIAGLPLGSTRQVKQAAMANILFEPGIDDAWCRSSRVVALNATTNVHWYGKRGTKARRKLGHITSVDDDLSRAERSVDAAMAVLKAQSGAAA